MSLIGFLPLDVKIVSAQGMSDFGKSTFIKPNVWIVLLTLGLFLGFGSIAFAGNKTSISRSAEAGELIEYAFKLTNYQGGEQTFVLSIDKPRLLACAYSLERSSITLEANGTYEGILSVVVSDRIPKGAFETATLTGYNADSSVVKKWKFISVRSKPHPFLLVTNDLLKEARGKIEKYQWAKDNFEELSESANSYEIPKREVVTRPRNTRVWDSFNYSANTSQRVFNKALVWQLAGDTTLRDEVVRFVRDVCDKEEGFLTIGKATTGVQVHEGNFFLYLAAICDILYGEDLLTETDKENIEATFRYYIELNQDDMSGVGIMNHEASAISGGVLAALFMEDLAELDHLMNAEGGWVDQLSKGTMPDGWWFESTANYSYLVVHRFAMVAQAFENFGWNLYDRRFPVRFKSKDFDNAKEGYTGMKFDIWGPMETNTIGLEEMFSGHIPMMDEHAVLVSSNDSNTPGPHVFYEFAYRHFRKDDLAWVINHSDRKGWGALIYGVPEIPEVEDPRSKSDFSPNVGLTALRSQTTDRPIEEQITAYLKFGTHGGWHGHFDRTGLIALDRNGHKYFGTEMCWFGYGHRGYKECVQTTATHNMITVDELQQEAVPSEQILFHAGEMMQASVVQTRARWRKIPTWNIEKFPPWDDKEFDADFEPILQRRLTVVTDEYVVIADYMKASVKHTYDWFLHPTGFKSIEGAVKSGDPLDTLSKQYDSPYKYFTNGQWYKMKQGAELLFDDEGNKLGVHTIWPEKADVLVAHYPKGGRQRGIRNNPDRRSYAVRIEGKEASFLHVIEPYMGATKIERITSPESDKLVVNLIDGREQTIKISNLESDAGNIRVEIWETLDGQNLRNESTK